MKRQEWLKGLSITECALVEKHEGAETRRWFESKPRAEGQPLALYAAEETTKASARALSWVAGVNAPWPAPLACHVAGIGWDTLREEARERALAKGRYARQAATAKAVEAA